MLEYYQTNILLFLCLSFKTKSDFVRRQKDSHLCYCICISGNYCVVQLPSINKKYFLSVYLCATKKHGSFINLTIDQSVISYIFPQNILIICCIFVCYNTHCIIYFKFYIFQITKKSAGFSHKCHYRSVHARKSLVYLQRVCNRICCFS